MERRWFVWGFLGEQVDEPWGDSRGDGRSEEHTSELQSRQYLVCRLLLEKKHRRTSGRGHSLRRHDCPTAGHVRARRRSEEHTSELQSRQDLVCRLLLEKQKHISTTAYQY